MGYAHGWTLKRDLTDTEWRAITGALQRLAQDLPQQVAKGPFRDGYTPTRWNERFMAVMWQRKNRPPFRGDPDGDGVLGPDGRTIVVKPGGPVEYIDQGDFLFHREAHGGWCKTNAGFYDRLVVATLLLTQRYARGALTVDSTDMEADHRRAIKAWIRDVLDAPPIPLTSPTPNHGTTGTPVGAETPDGPPPTERRPRARRAP